MKILVLTKKFPFPLKDGESIAVTNMTSSLATQGCDLHLLSMNTVKHWVNVDEIREQYNHFSHIETVRLDNRVSVFGALKNILTKKSYHISRFVFDDYAQKLTRLLQNNKYDIVQLETLYLAPYIEVIKSIDPSIKIVMRSHNIEYEIWERIASNTSNPLKKWYLNLQTQRLKAFDISMIGKYDGLLTVTERDRKHYLQLGSRCASLTMPIGLEISNYLSADINPGYDLSFIGSLDWEPNLEGLRWFLKSIWPIVSKQYPQLKLHIAGRNTPIEIKKLNSDRIVVHGEVDDAHVFLKQYPITIVPLLSGSGMRVKIVEGMALGRVVLSTTIGAEGIDARHNDEIVLADQPAEFVKAISTLLDDHDKQIRIGKNARSFIEENFDQSKNTHQLIEFYRALIQGSEL